MIRPTVIYKIAMKVTASVVMTVLMTVESRTAGQSARSYRDIGT